jgi:hypothetical protein
MKTKLIVLTLVVAITVVFFGFAQSSYAQHERIHRISKPIRRTNN